ncbi:UNVERIFIED_CONTAM: hypothetical protein FKN15_018252, partial [Acipenser sinensis]
IMFVFCPLGLPAVVVAITLGATYRINEPLNYRQEELKSRKTRSTMPLVSICSCMLIVNILFITGIGNPNADEVSERSNSSENTLLSSDLLPAPDKGSCTAVTALLHYFLLGTFAWTSLFAVQMYMSLVHVFSQPPQHFSMIIIGIGWGLPAVVVAITLGATYRINNPLNYRQEEFCWLAALDREGNFDITKPMLWGFLLPVAIILIFNGVIFVSVMACVLFKNTALTSTKRQSYLKKLTSSISVAVVLGITWVLGYLMLIDHDETRLVFSYIFCIINTTQTFKNNYTYSEPLDWITYMGCGLSCAGLCVTILYHLLTRKSRKTRSTMPLVSICSCMLIVNILFITGIGNPNADEVSERSNSSENTLLSSDLLPAPDKGSCTAVTALLHYFLLGTFAWTSLYAVQMYMSLVHVFSQPPQHFSMIIIGTGWGLPAVVVAITLGATYRINEPLNYRQEEFCWLAALDREGNFDITKPMLWGFLLPVAIILIFNGIIFVSVMACALFKNTALTSTKRQSYLKKLTSSISVAVVLGITWVLGYLMLIDHDETRLVFSYIFCIINTTQGLQIFILFTARDSVFQKKMKDIVNSISPPELYVHSKTFMLKTEQQDYVSESYKQSEGFSSTTFTSTSTVSPVGKAMGHFIPLVASPF